MDSKRAVVDPFDSAIAAALRGKLGEKNLTRKAVSAATGIPLVSVERYFKGQSPIPMSKFVSIAHALGVQAGEVIQAAEVIMNASKQKNGI